MFRSTVARQFRPVRPLWAAATMPTRRAPLNFGNGHMHGFSLLSTRPIDDLHMVVYECVHDQTGAKYYHIDSDDTNNAFCIGFRTPAQNDKGTTHVLEHTVLCGSKKYPVRDPFFKMLRRSLSTFMNAMTGADYTLYPFATTNTQDFANLLDVYLDAVFHPLLRVEDFKQEGHRVEVSEGDGAADNAVAGGLVYNGVVFNEMRGVVSEPGRYFSQMVMKTMLPGTHYEHVSGGYPTAILDLTHEELVQFHRDHYNPGNSVTMTYGSAEPFSHMKALNSYFSSYDRCSPVRIPALEPTSRFAAPRQVQLTGPLDPLGDPSKQKRVSVVFGVKDASNASLESVVQLSVLHSLLSSGPSSPMFKALIESQIGSRFAPMTEYAYYLSSPIIGYGVEGIDEARPGAEEEVQAAVLHALELVAKDGFDPRRVESVVFQEELQQRHRAADYGVQLVAGLCAMGLCRSELNPIDFINWLPHLKRVGGDVVNTVIPQLTANLLENAHRATIAVSAKADHLDHLRNDILAREAAMTSKATPEEVQHIKETTAQWLERVRAPEDCGVLPTLRVSDIPKLAFVEPAPVAFSQNVATIGHGTNGLVYVHGVIPFPATLQAQLSSGITDELELLHLPMLHGFLGKTGAAGMSYKEMSIQTDLVCGGFSFAPIFNNSYANKTNYISGTSFGFYTTHEKLADALKLLQAALQKPRTSREDQDVRSRILSMTKARCSRQIQSIQHSGNSVAVSLASAGLSTHCAVRERWAGLTQSNYASKLLQRLQGSEEEVNAEIDVLLELFGNFTQSLLLSSHGTFVWATCEETSQTEVGSQLQHFVTSISGRAASPPTAKVSMATVEVPLLPQSHPASAARTLTEKLRIDTSFVGLAIPNTLDWHHPDQAPLRVAAQLLRNEYLHRRVREEGGAYGSSASATLPSEVGGITMSSYRDPTPEKTQAAFTEAAAWLADKSNVTPQRLEEAKLRMFAAIDSPYAADSFGEAKYFFGISTELKQQMREQLLATTSEQVVSAAKYFDVTASNAVFAVLRPTDEAAVEAAECDNP